MLPTLTAVKVMLYQGMREQGIGKAELARRLGWHLPQVDRILDVRHNSRMDQVDAAMGAIAGCVKTPSQRGTDPRNRHSRESGNPGGVEWGNAA